MTPFTLEFHSQAETENFAQKLSLWARPGLSIALKGDLGSGKSTFARAFIKALSQNTQDFDVPSPSFSLVQTYDMTRVPVAHVDLYRLANPQEVENLALDELSPNHLLLIEWPERLGSTVLDNTLNLEFSGSGNTRQVSGSASGVWIQALDRNAIIENFIIQNNLQNAKRIFFEGDASSRRYEKLKSKDKDILLMDMPSRPDGPVVKFGKPYSQIAHLAEGIKSVFSINFYLSAAGHYSVPKTIGIDGQNGLALIEDLGSRVYGKMLLAGEDMTQPMLAAAELLADLGNREHTNKIHTLLLGTYIIPPYDEQAMLIEIELLLKWFWPHVHGTEPSDELISSFENIWKQLLPLTQQKLPQIVMRDFHSPNLLWLPERQGIFRVGLIDTQDAVMGHAAYDLVSMIQDARVDIPEQLAEKTFQHYIACRQNGSAPFSEAQFRTAYAVLGAQRATKILGIFARLNKRDGKPAYLKHMPRVSRYLNQNLEHPALESLKNWFDSNMPEALKIGLQ
jgi:N-acetylmuramate 1-kinase